MRSKLFQIGVILLIPAFTEAAVFQVPFGQNKTVSEAVSAAEASASPGPPPSGNANSKLVVTTAQGSSGKIQTVSAVYFQTNALDADNEVVACRITKDGSITEYKKFKTGGKGGQTANIQRNTVAPADDGGFGSAPTTDSLFSQHSLIVYEDYLFTVNAGSNTVSMFTIDPKDPLKLTQVGKPVTSHGDLPVSLAYSQKLRTLCVGNAGKKSGVACYNIDKRSGLGCQDKEPLQRTSNITKGDNGAGTISDLFFTTDDKNLIVVTKGNKAQNQTSTVDVYATTNGKGKTSKVSYTSVCSQIQNSPALYGTIQVSDTEFFGTDGTYGLAKLQFDPNSRKVTLPDSGTEQIDFQSQTSWIAKSDKTDSVYVSDLMLNRIVEFSAQDGNQTTQQSFLSGQAGNVDLIVGGDFLYTLSPSNKQLASNTSMIQIMYLKQQGVLVDIGSYVFDQADNITSQAHGMAVYDKRHSRNQNHDSSDDNSSDDNNGGYKLF
ncbi:hypothetical protein TWF694_001158 [Orbilia ellipsospora]|uniref:Uncharacterized protein n=1 Tax=Orbilia ellipsospora TaxID=2528407 RepID=A0AAV9XQZ9_9PEZI